MEEYGSKLSEEKSQFLMNSIKYLAQITDSKERRQDSVRSSSIKDIPMLLCYIAF